MKIELKKEIGWGCEYWYNIYVDGKYIDSTTSKDYEEALKNYEKVKHNYGKLPETEIIKSEEIE